jgi:hypothetical protein
MTSLLHPQFNGTRFRGSDIEALSYLRDTGWTSRMATPSPAAHLAGAGLLIGVGTWAGIEIAGRSPIAGIAVGVAALVCALIDVLPAAWTLTHRQYSEQYLAARIRFGDIRARLHPFLVLLGLPSLSFLAAGFTGADETVPVRLAWGLLGAAAGLAVGGLLVARARRSASPTGFLR